MDDEKKNITVSFLIGTAIGAGVAYFISDSGRKKTPELYDYVKKSLENIIDDPQKTLHTAENEVKEKAVDLKDGVSETIESIKTIGSLNIDKLLPRDLEPSNVNPTEDTIKAEAQVAVEAPTKKTRRFFKKK